MNLHALISKLMGTHHEHKAAKAEVEKVVPPGVYAVARGDNDAIVVSDSHGARVEPITYTSEIPK